PQKRPQRQPFVRLPLQASAAFDVREERLVDPLVMVVAGRDEPDAPQAWQERDVALEAGDDCRSTAWVQAASDLESRLDPPLSRRAQKHFVRMTLDRFVAK